MPSEFITTATGRHFYFEDPQPDQIDIADIAYALSHTNRWGGHCYPALSVAQHSVMVADALLRCRATQLVQLQGLMHDSAEAYLGDVPTPIKSKLPEYSAMELLVTDVIFRKWGIPMPMDPQVHLMDVEMRKWEFRDLMLGEGMLPDGNHPTYHVWTPLESEAAFVGRFYDLTMALGSDLLRSEAA